LNQPFKYRFRLRKPNIYSSDNTRLENEIDHRKCNPNNPQAYPPETLPIPTQERSKQTTIPNKIRINPEPPNHPNRQHDIHFKTRSTHPLMNGSNPERKTCLSEHLKQKQPGSAKEKADSQKEFSVTSDLKGTVHNTQKNNINIERRKPTKALIGPLDFLERSNMRDDCVQCVGVTTALSIRINK